MTRFPALSLFIPSLTLYINVFPPTPLQASESVGLWRCALFGVCSLCDVEHLAITSASVCRSVLKCSSVLAEPILQRFHYCAGLPNICSTQSDTLVSRILDRRLPWRVLISIALRSILLSLDLRHTASLFRKSRPDSRSMCGGNRTASLVVAVDAGPYLVVFVGVPASTRCLLWVGGWRVLVLPGLRSVVLGPVGRLLVVAAPQSRPPILPVGTV